MKKDSMKDERILAKGITVSNDTKVTGFNNNDLIIGSSGSGKTGGYVIPNLQNLNGSLVVSDTKGQLAKMFSKQLRDKGYRVYTLDLVHPEKSCGYNPLSDIRRYKNGRYREQDVLTLASNIMPMLDAVEPFWEQAAAGYIAFLIAFCLETLPPEEQNMISVCALHTRFVKPGGNLSFVKWAETHPDSYAAKKFTRFNCSANAERMWACIMEFANRALEPFDFEEARTIFENSKSFDISILGREKTVLFLNVSDTDRTFDNLVNVFYTQALQILCSNADRRFGGRLKVPVRIIMDDFAASARIPDFDKIISVIRSRDISVSLVLQSMTQLEAMYTHAEATTIINNCDHIIYLGSQDLQTAEFIGNRIFKTPDTVLCTPRNKAIIITTGEKAVIADKIKPYSTLKKMKGATMCNIKMLENAVTAAIELTESCKPDSRSDCRDVFHVVKYVRAAVRDFPDRSNSLEEMFNVLSMHTARLQKISGGKISEHIIVSDSGEVFPLPITNPYASLVHLIRQKLQKKDSKDYLRLHKIADLFMHRFSEYSDMADASSSLDNREMQDCLLYACFLVLGRYIDLLEQAMKYEDIPYDEITV